MGGAVVPHQPCGQFRFFGPASTDPHDYQSCTEIRGGYGSDRNIWCMAANYEYDTSQTEAAQGNSRWYTQVQAKYGQAPENLHDFPFEHLQFAPKDWKGGL